MLAKNYLNFIRLCEIGNISKAADELFISRQTLSEGIKKLEEETGVFLLVRSKSGITPTKEGRLLLEYAYSVQNLWEKSMLQINPPENPHISFSTDLSFINSFVYKLIAEFEFEHKIKVIIDNCYDHRDIWNKVAAHTVNVGLTTYCGKRSSDIEIIPADYDPVFILMSAYNPLSTLETIDYCRDLKDTKVYCHPHLSRRLNLLEPETGITTVSMDSHVLVVKKELVRENSVIIIPEHSIPIFTGDGLAARKCLMPINIFPYVVFSKDIAPQAKSFAMFILSVFKNKIWHNYDSK